VVRFVRFASNHLVRDDQAEVLLNLGRGDRLDCDGLTRLVASINTLPRPTRRVAGRRAGLVGDGLTVTRSRPMGTVHLPDGLWRQFGVDTA
jgi:hypothetical protein